MSDIKLVAEKREDRGKAAARRARRSGRIPAVVYGEIKEPIAISVDAHQLNLILQGHHSAIDLYVGNKKHRVIFREIQRHPVKDTVLHVDFMEVKKGHKVTMTVSVKFEGKPKGVKEGGILDIVKDELEIEVLPKDIPDEVVVDISELGVGETLRVKDITDQPFEILDEPEDVLCRIEAPKAAAETVEGEAEAEEEAAEPEVITAKDKEAEE